MARRISLVLRAFVSLMIPLSLRGITDYLMETLRTNAGSSTVSAFVSWMMNRRQSLYTMGVNLGLGIVQVIGCTICADDKCVAEYHTVEGSDLKDVSGLPIVAMYPYEVDGKSKCLECGEPPLKQDQRTYTVHEPRAHIKIFGNVACGKEECRAKADEIKKKDYENCVGSEKSRIICAACGAVYEGSKCGKCMVLMGK